MSVYFRLLELIRFQETRSDDPAVVLANIKQACMEMDAIETTEQRIGSKRLRSASVLDMDFSSPQSNESVAVQPKGKRTLTDAMHSNKSKKEPVDLALSF